MRGRWPKDHLFSLRQALKMYDAIQERINDYEKGILHRLAEMEREECRGQAVPKSKNPQKGRAIQKRGEEPMRQALYRMSGVDLTGIDAIGVETVQVVLSEYGPDLSRFPTEKQFLSHATLAAQANQRRQTGEKEETEQREHSSGRGAPNGGFIAAPQRERVRGLLSPHCATDRRRCGGICHCQETGHHNLPPAPVGAAVRGRGRRGLRTTIPGESYQNPDGQGQRTWLSTHAYHRVTHPPERKSQARRR